MKVQVRERDLVITESERLVAQSVNEYTVEFTFVSAWDGYAVEAVFQDQSGVLKAKVISDGAAVIPWEVLQETGYIRIGVFAVTSSNTRPTVWSALLPVYEGAEDGDPSTPTASTPWQEALLQMGQDVTAAAASKTAAETAQGIAERAAAMAAASSGTATFALNDAGHLIVTWTDTSGESHNTDIGEVSAYAVAVKNGYTGTEAQWETYIANASTNAAAAAASALVAEGYADGKQNGTAVESGSDYYHNNAKYYSEQAATSATAAQEAAGTASAAYGTNLLAPNYGDLTPPIAAGQHCIHSGDYYECISPITEAEEWTAAHWKQVTVGGETSDLKSALDYDMAGIGASAGFYPIPITGIGWIPCNKAVGETINLSDVRSSVYPYRYWIVPCVAGNKITAKAEGGTTTVRLFSFLDANNTVLYITQKQTTSFDTTVFTAPANTAKALIQDDGGNTQYFGTLYNIKSRFETLETADDNFALKVDNHITVTGSSTVHYQFTVGKSYLVTNNSDASISFRTRLSPSSDNVELMTVNAGITKVFNCTSAADGINIYIASGSINVYVQQMDTLEYRVTNNSARISALESDGVPSYFRTMIDTKLPQIKANMNEAGRNGDSFVFITDIHWENNAKHSLGLIKYIINNTNINKVLCGGDIISQGTTTNMMNDMNAVIKGLEFPFHNDLLVAFGNHDSNILSTVADSHFDLNTCYALMEKEAESYITMISDSDLSFYYDSKSNNTRYIVLDTGEDSGSSGRVFTAYQEFANILLDTPAGWNIVIMAHIVTYGRFVYISGMMDAYNARGVYTNENVGTFDFAEGEGKILCAFGGHTHVDSTSATSGGIPIIVTGTDSNRVGEEPEYPYVLGTDQEQSFDVVTINYTAKTIKCVRIGRGIDRTINYQ